MTFNFFMSISSLKLSFGKMLDCLVEYNHQLSFMLLIPIADKFILYFLWSKLQTISHCED